jgi:hypothetical protein
MALPRVLSFRHDGFADPAPPARWTPAARRISPIRWDWADPASYAEKWSRRSRLAAAFIRPGSSVMDVGCGPHMALRGFLPAGCTYQPVDLMAWTPDTIIADLSKGQFPRGHTFDVVVILGVLEYLENVEFVLSAARAVGRSALVSYHPARPFSTGRSAKGWRSHYGRRTFRRLIADAGWTLSTETVIPDSRQRLYAAS